MNRQRLQTGPLRVLFLATEPLDYEQEELEMLKVTEGLNMVLKSAIQQP